MVTANETARLFLDAYDKNFEYGAPSYDDVQISDWLTKAQWRVFTRTYSPDKTGFGFERNEMNGRDLEALLKNASLAAGTITVADVQTDVHPEGTMYNLPTDFYLAVEEAAKTAEKSKEAKVIPVTHDFYIQNIENPYKQPNKDNIWRMIFSRKDYGEDGGDAFTDLTPKRTELIVRDKANYPITAYRLRYIRLIPDIVVDNTTPANQRHCILQELIYDIIDEAVAMATAATKPEEYQIALNEKKES